MHWRVTAGVREILDSMHTMQKKILNFKIPLLFFAFILWYLVPEAKGCFVYRESLTNPNSRNNALSVVSAIWEVVKKLPNYDN